MTIIEILNSFDRFRQQCDGLTYPLDIQTSHISPYRIWSESQVIFCKIKDVTYVIQVCPRVIAWPMVHDQDATARSINISTTIRRHKTQTHTHTHVHTHTHSPALQDMSRWSTCASGASGSSGGASAALRAWRGCLRVSRRWCTRWWWRSLSVLIVVTVDHSIYTIQCTLNFWFWQHLHVFYAKLCLPLLPTIV